MIVRRVAAGLAMAAALLLVAAEFSTVYEVTVGSLEVVKRDATGGANHGYALLVVALVAVAVTGLGLREAGPGRAAGLALVALGAVALVVALAVDLPDARGSARLPESLAYEDARARAGGGLSLEIAGGVLLLVAGGLLALGRSGPALLQRKPRERDSARGLAGSRTDRRS